MPDGMMEDHERGRVGLSPRQSLSLNFFFAFSNPHCTIYMFIFFSVFSFFHHTTCLRHYDVIYLPQSIAFRKM